MSLLLPFARLPSFPRQSKQETTQKEARKHDHESKKPRRSYKARDNSTADCLRLVLDGGEELASEFFIVDDGF